MTGSVPTESSPSPEGTAMTDPDANPMDGGRDQFPARAGDWMQTFTGRRFWPLDPRPEDVCIEDIAHALSLLTRYGGHCTQFYSVAEHCVHLASAAPPENALWLLLHDGSEAYLSDMVRPLKRHMPEYRVAEDRVSRAVYEAFRLDPTAEPAEVKALDCRILMDERAQAMTLTGDTWNYGGATEPLGVTLQFWSPERAEREFLTLYRELTGLAVAIPALSQPAPGAAGAGLREALARTLYTHNAYLEALWAPDPSAPYPDAVKWNDDVALTLADCLISKCIAPALAASPAGAGSVGGEQEALRKIACLSPEANNKVWREGPFNDPAPYQSTDASGDIYDVSPDRDDKADMESFGYERGLHHAAVIARNALPPPIYLDGASLTAPPAAAETVGDGLDPVYLAYRAWQADEKPGYWCESGFRAGYLVATRQSAQAGAGDGWQPIETAPKDETDVLLRGPAKNGIWRPVTVAGWYERNVEPGWYSHENINEAIDMVPTQWARVPWFYEGLPAAPIGTGNGEASR